MDAMKTVLILDNLRSVYNVGSMFRTGNALKVSEIALCGITPTPLDKRGHKRKDFAKVALGSEDIVSWRHFPTTREAVDYYKEDKYFLIAIEQDKHAVDYKEVDITGKDKVAFIIGSEVDGVEKEALSFSDVIAEIPMHGTKESLNVTIAAGIALFRILNI